MLKCVRFTLVTLIFFLGLICAFPMILLRPFRPESAYPFIFYVRPLALKILGLTVEVRQAQRLQDVRPCIFIGNHQHLLDAIIIGCTMPEGTTSIMKQSLYYWPFFGFFSRLAGHYFIDRHNHVKAMATMAQIRHDMAKYRRSILIMPEGTRNKGTGLLPFKKGAFHLAIDAQVPLCPVVASSFQGILDFNRWRAGSVLVEVLPPIATSGKTQEQAEELLEVAHQQMLEAHLRLTKELLDNQRLHRPQDPSKTCVG